MGWRLFGTKPKTELMPLIVDQTVMNKFQLNVNKSATYLIDENE